MFFENAKKDITGYFGVFVGLFIVYAVRMKYKMDDVVLSQYSGHQNGDFYAAPFECNSFGVL